MNSVKLSVVIPAFNEANNLSKGPLEEVHFYLKKQDYSYEVLVIDDGSTDNTIELVEKQIKGKENFKIIKNTHGGKAITVMTGMLQSKGEIVVFTDMDQATPIDQVEKLFPKFDEGYEVVIGSRRGRKGAPLLRKINALGFVILRTIILGLPFSDTQCGFKAFNQKAVQNIFPKMLQRWKSAKVTGASVNAGFDVEALFIAKKLGLKITEVPVQWHYVGTERVKFFKEAFETIEDLFKTRINDLQGKYG